MSDLSASQWAQQVLEQLREIEMRCVDDDLFCVGYLIPQVELVETQYQLASAPLPLWQQRYSDFVEQCIAMDKLNSADVNRVREIIASIHVESSAIVAD